MQHDSNEICAMVFAAGLGTRLYPLTKDRPKALVEIHGKTLLETVIQRIIDSGIRHIVVNVHHFSDLMKEYLASHPFDADIRISDETDFLLDTGGGLKFAEPLFGNARHILLHNVDILSTLDLNKLVDSHITSRAMATLAVRQRNTSRYLIFDRSMMRLCGWENTKTDEKRMEVPCTDGISLGFSGIHIVRRDILDHIPTGQKISMTPLYLDLAAEYPIYGYLHQDDEWMDVGKYEDVVRLQDQDKYL